MDHNRRLFHQCILLYFADPELQEDIRRLGELQDGWLDGQGRTPTLKAIDLLCGIIENNKELKAATPTPDGGIDVNLGNGVTGTCQPDGSFILRLPRASSRRFQYPVSVQELFVYIDLNR